MPTHAEFVKVVLLQELLELLWDVVGLVNSTSLWGIVSNPIGSLLGSCPFNALHNGQGIDILTVHLIHNFLPVMFVILRLPWLQTLEALHWTSVSGG